VETLAALRDAQVRAQARSLAVPLSPSGRFRASVTELPGASRRASGPDEPWAASKEPLLPISGGGGSGSSRPRGEEPQGFFCFPPLPSGIRTVSVDVVPSQDAADSLIQERATAQGTSYHRWSTVEAEPLVGVARADAGLLPEVEELDASASFDLKVVTGGPSDSTNPWPIRLEEPAAGAYHPGVAVVVPSVVEGSHLQVTVEKSVPVVGWAIVALALAGSSFTTVMFASMGTDVHIVTRLSWRMQAGSIILLPIAVHTLARSASMRRALANPQNLALVLLSGAAWFAHFLTFVLALDMTSAANALLFNSLTPLLLLGLALVQRQPILRSEGMGAVVAVAGAGILAMSHAEPEGAVSEPDPARARLGDVVAFLGSFGGLCYMIACKRLRPVLSPMVTMCLMNGIAGAAAAAVAVLCVDPEPYGAFSARGFLGWLGSAVRFVPTVVAAFICDILGNMGFIVALKYLPALVISVVILLQPLGATVVGVSVGLDKVPDPLAAAGMLVTVLGTAMVVLGAAGKTSTTVDVALH